MMTTFDLSHFRVPAREVLKPGDDLTQACVGPIEDMRILKFVADDESSQHRAFNFMWDSSVGLALRGCSESETSHPAWNSFKKAIGDCNMTIPMMKLSLACALPKFHFAFQKQGLNHGNPSYPPPKLPALRNTALLRVY